MSRVSTHELRYVVNEQGQQLAVVVPLGLYNELVGLLRDFAELADNDSPEEQRLRMTRKKLVQKLAAEQRYLTDAQGHRLAVELNKEDYGALLESAEDMDDIRAAEAAQVEWETEGRPVPRPLEDVLNDLDLGQE